MADAASPLLCSRLVRRHGVGAWRVLYSNTFLSVVLMPSAKTILRYAPRTLVLEPFKLKKQFAASSSRRTKTQRLRAGGASPYASETNGAGRQPHCVMPPTCASICPCSGSSSPSTCPLLLPWRRRRSCTARPTMLSVRQQRTRPCSALPRSPRVLQSDARFCCLGRPVELRPPLLLSGTSVVTPQRQLLPLAMGLLQRQLSPVESVGVPCQRFCLSPR